MKQPETPKNESERLIELESYQLIGLAEDEDYDFITSMAAEICGTKISLISLITEDKQWFLSHKGVDVRETPKQFAFCAHAINNPDVPFIVEDARKDERFYDNPLTTGDAQVIFYAGVPLVTNNGYPLGTICVIDDTPKKLNKAQLEKLKKLGRQTVKLFESRKKSIELDFLNQELENKNELLRDTQDANNLGIWEMDIATRTSTWSELVYTIHEVPKDYEHNKANNINFYHPNDKPIITNAITACISQGTPFDLISQMTTAKDRWIWVRNTGRKVGDKLIGSIQDITYIKHNEIRFKSVIEGTNVGTWEWNVQTGETVFNERWAEIVGYTLEELAPISIDTWIKLIHPDDLKESRLRLNTCFEKKGNYYELEARMKHKDGNWIWVYDRGKVFDWTKDGKPLMMYGTHQDITKRIQAENVLLKAKETAEESERKYSILAENMETGLVLHDSSTQIIFSNSAASGILGLSKDQMLGKKAIDPAWSFVKEDGSPLPLEDYPVNKSIKSKNPLKDYVIGINIPGSKSPKWVSVNAVPVLDNSENLSYVSITFVDITQSKKAKLEIKRHSQIFEDSLNEIFLFDSETFKFIQVNRASQRNIGYTMDELQSMTPLDIKPEFTPERFKELIKPLFTKDKGIIEFETVHQRKDKSLYNVEIHLQLMQFGEKDIFVAIINDITERKQLEKEIKAKEIAEESDRLKTAFLANMSHEIRTPMNAILGFTNILKRKNLSEEKKDQYLQLIESGGRNLLNLISDIVDLSKIDANQLTINIDPCNINQLIDNLLERFNVINTNTECEIIVNKELPDDLSVINTDDNRLSQILSNLLENALKFTEKGIIEFGYLQKGEILEFFVKDSGIGINKKDQAVIFDRFRQANNDYKKSKSGTGLGLAIVKNLTELLGGEIWVESEVHQGATFRFTLPYTPVKEREDNTEKIKVYQNLTAHKTILIAEDNYINFMFFEALLEELDFKIIHAENGKLAVDIVLENNSIDLVLMDVGMPLMDGLEATKKIRETNKTIPIIAITGYAMAEDKKNLLNAGCDDYLSKPISEQKLFEVVEKYTKKDANGFDNSPISE